MLIIFSSDKIKPTKPRNERDRTRAIIVYKARSRKRRKTTKVHHRLQEQQEIALPTMGEHESQQKKTFTPN